MKHIEHIVEPDKLLLSWQTPRGSQNRMRMFIAELIRTGDDATLLYLNDSKDFKKAKGLGFKAYPGYSIEQNKHKNVLMSFLKRIPPRKRKDFDRFLNSLRIDPEMVDEISDFALLGYSRASLPSDEFTLIHPFNNARPPFELLTPVQGYEYYTQNISYQEIKEGMEVTFTPEPNNPYDQDAIRMLIQNKTVGYVCRGLLASFHKWLNHGYNISASIERINGDPENPRLFVFISVR